MIAMGEEPVLSSRRLPTDWDPTEMAENLERTPEERLTLAAARNRSKPGSKILTDSKHDSEDAR
jgi:hypothetical protein